MHGRGGGEERKRAQHMWKVPSRATKVVNGDGGGFPSSPSSSTVNYFIKDGRKISVGDCALFQPAQDSPPFIGIIRSLASDKENKLNLSVNWLYRPAEVKLGKGILLEAVPNEIFYSFHEDATPAASLLHPCKVAFLPKRTELPSGISSFVCWRVYDIERECLWWLTDQDYIDERQEEVDQLLYKTRLEMHATVQPGGRSPKPMNGPTSASQLKPGSDGLQNSASSFPSQAKGKKRERVDQASESVKRVHTASKMDDVDSGQRGLEVNLKSEITKITEKGGLEDSEGVEKLVQLMQSEKNEKKVDLLSRSVLAGVVAATENIDCLSHFIQLRGLPVFDGWLQEVHKGKIGNGSGTKDGEKSIEEFLLVLLRALDRLPINLDALQMCNIGRSVNHLRSHKNLEIQKKARSLVDTWKKRVEAEMDAKTGSNQAVTWPARPRLSEASHGASKHTGSSEVANKSLVTQVSASKAGSIKVLQGEAATKPVIASPGSLKAASSPASAGTNWKDGQSRNATACGAFDPQTTAREEKSTSSSQSHNNSQSCSSDVAKTGGFPMKEETKSSVGGSVTVNKISSGSSRHRKSVNGFQGQSLSGVQRDSGSSKNYSLHRNPSSEKPSQTGLTAEKAVDVPVVEGNSHKLIVKITNRGKSPARCVSGGSFEDHSVTNSRASSPVIPEKQEQFDQCVKEKGDALRANVTAYVNTESWQSNDFKDVLIGSDEGGGTPAAALSEEENCRSKKDAKKTTDVLKTASSSTGNGYKLGKSLDASFSSINALIDSVKYSEANASVPVGDDAGMNLLASVAAGEICRSDVASPTDSPHRNTPVIDHSSVGHETREQLYVGDDLVRERSQPGECADDEHHKQSVTGKSWSKITDKPISSEEKIGGDSNGLSTSGRALPPSTGPCLDNGKLKGIAAVDVPSMSIGGITVDVKGTLETKHGCQMDDERCSVSKEKQSSALLNGDKDTESVVSVGTVAIERSLSVPFKETDIKNKKNVSVGLDSSLQPHDRSLAIPSTKGADMGALETDSRNDIVSENKPEKDDETDASVHNIEHVEENKEGVSRRNSEHDEENKEGTDINGAHDRRSPPKVVPAIAKGSQLAGKEEEAEEQTSATTDSHVSTAGGTDVDAKMGFDLNEGLHGDEGKYGEPNILAAPGCSAPLQLLSPLPFPVTSVPSSLPASITVAAAAKGPFVPPDDLLRTKGVLGWKGSAATSAFRPAEPRRVLDMPLGTSSISSDAPTGRQSRPPLDIDLNIPDERVLEDLAIRSSLKDADSAAYLSNNGDFSCGLMGSTSTRSTRGFDLDLNRVDEPTDLGPHSISRRLDIPFQPIKSSLGGIFNREASVQRDFDLNNGPGADDTTAEPSLYSQHTRNENVTSQAPVHSLRMNNAEMGNFSWFPTGNTYSAVSIPSILSDRGEQPFPIVATGGSQRVLGPPAGATPFNQDLFRGPVLSSSPAVSFPSTPYQYPVFPFGTSFPLTSSSFSGGSTFVDSSSSGRLCFPSVPSQLLGPAGAIPSHYARPPYVVSLSDGSNNSGPDNGRKWGRQGFDLNAGPGGADIDGRDESRHISVSGSQALAEEQARMYQLAGGVLKRKEPDGGWDGYKQQPSWQ